MMKGEILVFAALIVFLLGCKKEGCTDPTASNYSEKAKKDDGSCIYPNPTYSSSVEFKHQLNAQSFDFDSLSYTHPAGYDFSIEQLKYFISDLVLYQTSGDSIILSNIHYVDVREGTGVVLDFKQAIPNTSYTGVGFTFGVAEAYNITGYFNNPPETLMEWPTPMGGGYHNMKLEGKYDSSGVINNYAVHTGRLLGVPYSFKVTVNQSFTITDNDVYVPIIMNIENWFQQPNLYDFNVFSGGIMGNSSAQQTLMENGTDVFTLGTIQ